MTISNNAQVISFVNMKGGVGKTTLTINIADTLARIFEKKILLVDMDPQFNATQSLMTKYKDLDSYEKLRTHRQTINSILQPLPEGMGVCSETEDAQTQSLILNLYNGSSGKLDFIPGDLEITTFESSRRGSERRLKDFLNEQKSDYDYILIDTPATYSIFSQSALLASDFFIVPIAPDTYSALGYSLLNRIMKEDLALKDA